MRLSSLSPLFAVALLPLIAQACAAGQVDTGSTGDGGSSSASTSAATGGAASASSSTGTQGPCQSAADCAASADACNTGACINGVCGKLPANEFGACDDGINCTENDTCQGGVCTGGTTKFCPATDTCSVGSCDIMTDTCIQVPGNNGAQCNDDDACTLPGSCSNGVCTPGGMVDCSFLDGTCSQGYCDPQIGCKVMPKADGAPCNDNLYCTVNDVCSNGQCMGVPNTCAAPGDVCMIGSCDEANDKCTAVPGNNGGACNDNNLCTTGETCLNGVCQGGAPVNNGMMCDDNMGCTLGTTCSNGVCGNPGSMVMQCINGDGCCPAGCVINNDDDCIPPTSFQVLDKKDITYNGIDYVLLKVSMISDQSVAANWCYDYQNLCAGYNAVPTGCGQMYTNMNNGYGFCKTMYGSNGVSDSLGCNPSGGISAAAQQAGFNDATGENSFGFHYCDAGTCSKTMCSGMYCNTALSYIDMTKPHGYTLCKK